MKSYPGPPGQSHPHPTMKLEAVITSVEYGDFLAHTLPLNKSLFDRIVVVTSHMDKLTKRVCEFYEVQCLLTDAFGAHLGEFRKGAGINAGLAALDRDGWLLHMDADIICPPLTRRLLEQAGLETDSIYGADRLMVPSYEAWAEFQSKPKLQHENRGWCHLDAFPLGVRVVIEEYGGYIPIGFFQLWHSSQAAHYPQGHTDAAREDVLHTLKWPRAKRRLLSDLVVYHLESEKAEMGANWAGRKTKLFTAAEKS